MVGGERCGHQANVYGDTAEELAGPIVTGLADQPLVTLEEAVKNPESYLIFSAFSTFRPISGRADLARPMKCGRFSIERPVLAL